MLIFGFDTNTKLLHYSNVSSTSSLTIICCFCRCSNYFFNDLCRVYVTCLGGTWYGFMPSLTWKENVPLKHPILKKYHDIHYAYTCAIIALAAISVSFPGSAIKQINFQISVCTRLILFADLVFLLACIQCCAIHTQQL